MTDSDVTGIRDRLDDLFSQLGEISTEVKGVQERCEPCSKLVQAHQQAIYGNGKSGIQTNIATLKSGRVDTLSIPSICKLVGAFGAALAAVVAAMAAFN